MKGCEYLKCPQWNGKMCIHPGDVCIQRPTGDDRQYVRFSDYLAIQKELTACQARVKQQKTVLKMKSDWLDTANKTISCREAQCNILKARVAELEKQVNGMKQCSNCVNQENDQPCYQCRDKSLWKWKGSEPLYRCADRDDGCGHCPRSEPHTHPDEQPGTIATGWVNG